MFSRLDPVFQAMRRQAENTDTKLGIRRDEKNDENQRKNKKEKDEESAALWEDVAVVSVPALQAFLSGLVPASIADAGHAEISISASAHQASPTAPVSDAARAAQASRSTPGRAQPPASSPAPSPGSPGGVKLSAEEEITIFRLISDLTLLSSRGVTSLEIRKSDSFLQSLVDAVKAAL